MTTHGKTKDELLDELATLRSRVAELEQAASDRDQMVARLRQDRDAAEELVEAAQTILLVLDTEGRIARFNPYMEQLSGYSLEEVQGKDWFTTFLPQGDQERMRALFRTAIGGTQTRGNVNPIVTKDGREREIEWYDKTLQDPAGNTVGLVCIGQDITDRKRAEEALRQSEERLRLIIESAEDAVILYDLGGKYVYYNGPSRYGVEADQLLGKTPFDVLDEQQATRIAQEVAGVISSGEGLTVENRVTWPGKTVWFCDHIFPVRDAEGRITSVGKISRNITDRKEAEEALRREKEFSDCLVSSSVDGILAFDLECRYTVWNPGMERISGVSKAEALGRSAFDVFPFLKETGQDGYHYGALAGEVLVAKDRRYVVPETGREGFFEGYYSPLRSPSGEIMGGLGVIRDITDRKRAEEALRRTTDLLAAIKQAQTLFVTEGDPERVFTTLLATLVTMTDSEYGFLDEVLQDGDGESYMRNLTISDAALNEESRRLQGQLPASGPKVQDLANLFGAVASTGNLVISNDPSNDPRSGGFPKGHPPLNAFMGIPIYFGGELVGVAGVANRQGGYSEDLAGSVAPFVSTCASIIQDLRHLRKEQRSAEERRQMEAQLQHAQKLESLGILAGGIAHDFNNLLVGILGNASLLLHDLPPKSPARESVRLIETSAMRAAELTNQMLAYSGRGAFVVGPLDLSRLVQDISQLVQPSISKKVIVNYSLADDLPAIVADPTQIRQVVMNLITNASEAIGQEGGTISISTGAMDADHAYLAETHPHDDLPEGRYVYLDVADTGCGMDAETISKVFDPFFTTKFTGRGLGLAATLGIVRGHRGAIKIDSRPGRGTAFRVLFPASDEVVKEEATVDEQAGAESPGAGTILVVDDEAQVLKVAVRILERAGYSVLTASDGRQAVRVFRERADEIAAVLLDLTMPGLDGQEAFDEIRRIQPDARIILSSGYKEQDVLERFVGRGLAGFIQKPYRPEKLLTKIRQALAT